MKVTYTENNTHVEDSYKCEDIGLEVMQIMRERHLRKLKVTRTFESYVREWRGHNNLYRMGLFRSHTKDVDLEENIPLWKEIIWMILSL